jgi:PAS domain-containing protein
LDPVFALDIESALTELERARAAHADWVAAVHQALITGAIPDTLDLSPESHRRSPLGLWCEQRCRVCLHGLVDHARLLAVHREAHAQVRRLVLGLKQDGPITLHRYESLARCLGELDGLLSALVSRAAQLLTRTWRIAAAAFDQCTEAVLVTDPRGVIIYVNPGFTEVTGFEADEAVGKTPRLFKSVGKA